MNRNTATRGERIRTASRHRREQEKEELRQFQQAFFRAGHAHAGVLVILSPLGLILADAAQMSGLLAFLARNGIWAAAILMPAGFFLSAAGKGITRPNRFIVLLYLGVASLALGVVSLGIGLLTT